MTDLQRQALENVKEYFEEKYPGRIIYPEYLEFHEYKLVCEALDEEKDGVMASNFLATVENGVQTPMKLVESNIQFNARRNHFIRGEYVKGAIPPVVVVVTR